MTITNNEYPQKQPGANKGSCACIEFPYQTQIQYNHRHFTHRHRSSNLSDKSIKRIGVKINPQSHSDLIKSGDRLGESLADFE